MEEDKIKKMNKNKNLLILLLCVVCIILSAIILLYKSYFFKEQKQEKSSNSDTLIISEEELEKYINYIPNGMDEINLDSFSPYRDVIVTKEDVSLDLMLAMALNNIDHDEYIPNDTSDYYCYIGDGKCNFYVESDKLKNKIKEMYGIDDVSLDEEKNFYGVNGEVCYYYNNDYGCAIDERNVLFKGELKSDNHRIIDYSTAGPVLHIYEEYFNIRYLLAESESLITFEIYRYSNSRLLMGEKEYNLKEYLRKSPNYDDILFDELKDNLTKYDHTFIKDEDGNYVWVSSEPIK